MRHLARALVFLLTLSLAPQAVFAQSEEEDRGYLQAFLEDNLSGAGRQIRIVGFEGALSSVATIEELTIADDAGIWLTLRGVELDWSRAALLRGRVEVNALTAEEVLLPRLPSAETTTEDLPEPEATPFSLPELPVSIRIDELSIDRVELGAGVIGVEAALSATGSAELAGGEGTASLQVQRLDGAEGSLDFTASYANETRQLSLDLDLQEEQGGLLSTLLSIPDSPAMELTVTGEGPLDDFTADLALATDGTDRLTGQVTLAALQDDAGLGFNASIDGDVRPLMPEANRAFFGPELSLAVEGESRESGELRLNTLDLTTDAMTLDGQVRIGADGWPALIDVTGRIAHDDDTQVVLPVAGGDTEVQVVDLSVQYDASEGDAWTAEITLDDLSRPDLSLGSAALTGNGTLTRGTGSAVGRVQGGFDIDASQLAFSDPGLASGVGDALTGRITFDWQEGMPLNLPEIRLSGDEYALDGTMSVEIPEDRVSPVVVADLQVTADDVSRFSALAGQELGGDVDVRVIGTVAPLDGTFDATVNGTANDLVTGIAELDGLLDGQSTLAIDAARDETGVNLRQFDITAPGATITADGQLNSTGTIADFDITLPETALAVPQLQGQTRLRGNVRQTGGSYALDLDANAPGGVVFDGQATVQVIEGVLAQVSGRGSLAADNLSLYSQLAQRDLAGGLDITGSGTFDPRSQNFEADIEGSANNLRVDVAQVDNLMQGRSTFDVVAARVGDRVDLTSLTLTTPRITASGNGILRDENSNARFDVALVDLADVLPELSGAAELAGTVTQNGDAFEIDIDGTGPGRAAIDALATVTYTYDGLENIAAGTLGPVSGSGTVSADDLSVYSGVAGRDLGGAVSVEGNGSFDPETQYFEADVSGTSRDLRTGIEQADNLLAGVTTFTVDAGQDAEGLLVRNLRVENPQLTASGEGILRDQASAARFDVVLEDLADALPRMAGSGGARLSGSIDQAGDDFAFDITGSGPGGLAVDAEGTVRYADDTLGRISGQGTLRASDLSAFSGVAGRSLGGSFDFQGNGGFDPADGSFDVALTGSANNLRSGIAAVDQLTAGRSTVTVDAARGADGRIVVETFDLATPQLTADANGALSPNGSGQLSYNVVLRNLGLFAPGFDGQATARGTASSSGGEYRIDTALTGPGGTTADVAGTIAPDFSRVNLSANGSAPLALVNQFTEPNILSGTAQFNLRVNGAPGLDAVSGTVTSSGAQMVIQAAQLTLENINANVNLTGGRAQIDLQSGVSTGGSLSVTGPVTLSAPFNGDLSIALNSVGIVRPGLIETEVNGALTLRGALTRDARLAGNLDFETMEIRIPDTGLGAAGLDFTLNHVNEPADVRRTRERAGLIQSEAGASGPGINYPLDIVVNAPSRIFIRGRGLDAELGGTLRLGGTTSNIIPAGSFELIRGRLDILGQRLDLAQARIQLEGDFNAFIFVRAETTRAETSINIVIQGPVSDPDVTISSSPDRPEEEVLALLLFGRDVTEISAFQAVRIAAAVNTLVGRGGTGIVDRLRTGIGLDDFDVQTAADGSTELRFGKYIGENLYTDVTVNSEGSTDVNLNLDITPQVTARGTVGTDGNTSLGIFFEKDY